MAENMPESENDSWKAFLRRHWGMFALFVVGAILGFVGAVYVFLWFVADAQSTGLVPSALNLWTLGNCVSFVLYLIFWELVLVGIPVAVAAVIGWLWWRGLPYEERRGYRIGSGCSRAANGGRGAVSLFLFIGFCVKVLMDGNWSVPVANWTFNYVVYSLVWVFVWIAVIVGIPLLLCGIWWLRREMKRTP